MQAAALISDLLRTVFEGLAFVAAVMIFAAIATVIANLTTGRLHDVNSKPNLKTLRNTKFKTRNPRNNPIT